MGVDEPASEKTGYAFLGVMAMKDVSDDAGGVVVGEVLDDGPSAGILAESAVIVAIDGRAS